MFEINYYDFFNGDSIKKCEKIEDVIVFVIEHYKSYGPAHGNKKGDVIKIKELKEIEENES